MLTVTTGASFFAVARSNRGISTRGKKAAERWRRATAMRSWMRRKRRGRSGEELSTALFLWGNRDCQWRGRLEASGLWRAYTKTIWERDDGELNVCTR